ncbi:hypothetical protein Taro_053416 [Colocasia esculenta]|uniref:Cytochrome P450 n=1 Tax=Colocasia esculenta TaxID=4460 RepID=A0A843XMJ4_COLES|nr:hypothetical protein [Colocasia esculenta]
MEKYSYQHARFYYKRDKKPPTRLLLPEGGDDGWRPLRFSEKNFLGRFFFVAVVRLESPLFWSYQVEKEDILSRDPENVSIQYLREIVLNFVVADKDTTGGTLAWFLYMLCKHHSVQEKIALKVKQAVRAGEDATFQEFAGNISEESLEKMQYLHATLNETLRLYPALPLDPKVCFLDDKLPDGFDNRKGEIIV